MYNEDIDEKRELEKRSVEALEILRCAECNLEINFASHNRLVQAHPMFKVGLMQVKDAIKILEGKKS